MSVGIRDLQRDPSGIIRQVTRTGRPAVVTNRGEPVAAVVPVDPDALEDFILANAPSFVAAMVEADAAVIAGETREASEVFREIREESPTTASPDPRRLTPREREILSLLADGRTNAEIARALHVSPGTVRNNIRRILGKLDIPTQAKAAASRKR
jgi:prevent-host-death family protein